MPVNCNIVQMLVAVGMNINIVGSKCFGSDLRPHAHRYLENISIMKEHFPIHIMLKYCLSGFVSSQALLQAEILLSGSYE